jgi:hypothetical protein
MPTPTKQKRTLISVLATPDISAIRTAEFAGEKHTVIPVVMLKEGVLWPSNASGPELALAEEFGRHPESWNGRPVVLGHPTVDGIPVSASSPGVLEAYQLGQIFNTRLDGKSLKSEIWINEARLSEMDDDFQKSVARLKDGDEVVEVSVGAFMQIEDAPGVYEGQKFERIWRNVVPDHLAVLPEGIVGACSVEMGCGAPRVNKAAPEGLKINAVHLPYKQVPPVIREAHECGCEDKNACACGAKQREAEHKTLFDGLRVRMRELLQFKAFRENQELVLSDQDIRHALSLALQEKHDSCWVVAVFQSGNKTGSVVYEDLMDMKLYAQDFSISDSGTITLTGERMQVRPETHFVPVDIATATAGDGKDPTVASQHPETEDQQVNKEQRVAALIASKANKFEASDKDWLMSLEEAQLAKFEVEEPKKDDPPANANANANANSQQQQQPKTPATAEEYIAMAPKEIQAVLAAGVQMHRQRKDALIKALSENKRNKFTKEQLEAKDLSELEILAELADVPDYSGAAPVHRQMASGDDEGFTPPPPDMFPVQSTRH